MRIVETNSIMKQSEFLNVNGNDKKIDQNKIIKFQFSLNMQYISLSIIEFSNYPV